MATLRELLKSGEDYLADTWKHEAADKDDPDEKAEARNDARILMFHAAGCDMTSWPLVAGDKASQKTEEDYMKMIKRRAAHEPLQYITGEAPFYGRYFKVRPGVLIPRFDTETIIEAVLPELKKGMKILDMCCGSGCILLTLMLEGPAEMHGTGADISERALAAAKENAARFKVDAGFIRSNLFENIDGVYDIIVSNPPYIPTRDIASLAPEVRDFEPREALDGDADGLSFYRKIINEAPEHLKENGLLAFEIGYDEAENVRGLMKAAGFADIKTVCDIAGNLRCVTGRNNNGWEEQCSKK